MSKPYTPSAWYWIVAGDTDQLYSSAAAAYVPATDPDYLAWVDDGGVATRIASDAELREVFAQQYPEGWPADAARVKRTALLAACDWTQARDIPEAISSAWSPYRQSLRDITAQAGFPHAITWPEAPQ